MFKKISSLLGFLLIVGITIYFTGLRSFPEIAEMIRSTASAIFMYLKDIIIYWPPIVLFSVLLFRKELSELIPRFKKFGPKGVEVSPEQEKSLEVGRERDAEHNRKLDQARGNATRAINIAKKLLKELSFERAYNGIYGSQINILERLRSLGTGLTVKRIRDNFYDGEYLKKSKDVGYSFALYMNFLKSWGLVSYDTLGDEDLIKSTTEGVEFLDYIEKQNYTKLRPF